MPSSRKRAEVPDHVRNSSPPLVIMGVDPGTLITGYGIIARHRGRLSLLGSGTIRNRANSPLAERLRRIHEGLSQIIRQHQPNEFVVESAFYGKNAQSALKLGHARGVALLSGAESDIPVVEYSPREIKKSVTGNGQASKQQVRYMVRSILSMADDPLSTDTSDAIAAALCHMHRLSTPMGSHRSWKTFVDLHPERVID